MLLDYCLLEVLKRERDTLCSIYGPRSVCKQLRQSVKVSLNFIRLLRVVFSSQQLLPLMLSSDAITTRKPGSDFDWLIV